MNKALAVRQYLSDAKADISAMATATVQPISRSAAIGLTSAASLSAIAMNAVAVFATSTQLFSRLDTAVTTLLSDAQALMSNVASFALIVCIIGIFVASMLGPKATSVMTSALKTIICFFIFWQLVPVILGTITHVFGGGPASPPPDDASSAASSAASGANV